MRVYVRAFRRHFHIINLSSLIFFNFKKLFVGEKDDDEEGKEEKSLPEVEPTEQDEEGYAVIYDSQSSLKLRFC